MTVRADQHFTIIPEWVLYSPDLSATAVRLYGALRRYADKEGKAHPSRTTLGRDIHVKSVRTVDAALAELERIGAVQTVQRREGRVNLTSLYTVITAPPRAADCTGGSAADCAGVVQQAAPEGEPRGREPLEREKAAPVQSLTAASFDAFWNVYPRKAEKPRALREWAKALQRTDAGTIIQGAGRYRDDPHREAAFTKHPATWLHNDCWNDPPLPPRRGPDKAARLKAAAEQMRKGANDGGSRSGRPALPDASRMAGA